MSNLISRSRLHHVVLLRYLGPRPFDGPQRATETEGPIRVDLFPVVAGDHLFLGGIVVAGDESLLDCDDTAGMNGTYTPGGPGDTVLQRSFSTKVASPAPPMRAFY